MSHQAHTYKEKRERKIQFDVYKAIILCFREIPPTTWYRNRWRNVTTKPGEFVGKPGHSDVNITMSWIERFKKQYGIAEVKLCGESSGVDERSLNVER